MNFMTYLTVFLPIYLSSLFENFKFYPMGFVEQLWNMVRGMLCIFIVIGVIIVIVVILEKITSRDKNSNDDSTK